MKNEKLKVAYICAFAHVTVIEKGELTFGRLPETLQCTTPHCLQHAHLFSETVIDESVLATHKFFDKNDVKEIINSESDAYLQAGGLMFREIPENVQKEVKAEFKNTSEILKLATFLVNTVSEDDRVGTPVDTAIDQINQFKKLQQTNLDFIRGKRLSQN